MIADYGRIFLFMMACSIVPPLPLEPIVSVGGIEVAEGRMDFALVVLSASAGTVVGNLFWWALCRRLRYERMRPFVDRWQRWLTIDWTTIERLHRHFERGGAFTVFVFRFMPVGRTLISIPAGLMGMPFWRFTLCTGAGSLVWSSMLAGIGYGLRLGFSDIQRWVSPIAAAVLVAIVAVYLWRVATWKPRRG